MGRTAVRAGALVALASSSSLPINGFFSSSSSGDAALGGVFGGVGVLAAMLGFAAGGLGGCLNELDDRRLTDGDDNPDEVGTVGCGVGKRLMLLMLPAAVLAASRDIRGIGGDGEGDDVVR